jgi:hypothetical protein
LSPTCSVRAKRDNKECKKARALSSKPHAARNPVNMLGYILAQKTGQRLSALWCLLQVAATAAKIFSHNFDTKFTDN